MWNRPFKLVSELYYKSLTDVNTYTIDNVRIRYAASSKGYAQGLDLRLNGICSGTESWIALVILKQRTVNRGYLRPTDQRLKFALYFGLYA
jgi:hypothetical protein